MWARPVSVERLNGALEVARCPTEFSAARLESTIAGTARKSTYNSAPTL